jgi:hypothetical protein
MYLYILARVMPTSSRARATKTATHHAPGHVHVLPRVMSISEPGSWPLINIEIALSVSDGTAILVSIFHVSFCCWSFWFQFIAAPPPGSSVTLHFFPFVQCCKSGSDPAGFETFSRIRIRTRKNHSGSGQLRIQNEFEVKLF